MRIARVLLIVCALFASASAENKSWNAVKNRLPPGTWGIVTVDGKALRSSTLFGKALGGYFARYRELDLAVQAIKGLCGFDPTTAITDATGVGHADGRWWVFGLDGVDAAKALDCGKRTAAVMAKMTVSAKTDGATTEYTWTDDNRKSKSIVVAWIAKDVVVLSSGGKRAYAGLETPGKPLEAELAAAVAKASAGAPPAWVAAHIYRPDNRDGYLGAYFTANLAKSTVTVAGHLITTSADARSKESPKLQKELARAIDHEKNPELQRIWKAVKLGENGADITIDASASEDDFVVMMPLLESF